MKRIDFCVKQSFYFPMRFALALGLFFMGYSLAPAAPVPAPATNAAASDRSVFAKKPKIEDLMKLDRFTNSTGLIMVRVSSGLWASMTLISQDDYQKVLSSNPSQFRGAQNPVDSVSWRDALDFCSRLTEADKKEEMLAEGFAYTLPTQSQWEGLLGGATIANAITSHDMIRAGPASVTSAPANSLGLYDARGNVWQWCLDPDDKPYRVLRGGAWNENREMNLRPEFRWYSNGPDDRQNIYGFRVVLVASGK